MVERKLDAFDGFIGSVHKIVDGKAIGLVHGTGTRHMMQHRANDDIWIDDGEVESSLVLFHKLPRCFLGQFL